MEGLVQARSEEGRVGTVRCCENGAQRDWSLRWRRVWSGQSGVIEGEACYETVWKPSKRMGGRVVSKGSDSGEMIMLVALTGRAPLLWAACAMGPCPCVVRCVAASAAATATGHY